MSVQSSSRKTLNAQNKRKSFKKGTNNIRSVLLASDKMMRAVHMFLKVTYMDVTVKTNKHLLVAKGMLRNNEWEM